MSQKVHLFSLFFPPLLSNASEVDRSKTLITRSLKDFDTNVIISQERFDFQLGILITGILKMERVRSKTESLIH